MKLQKKDANGSKTYNIEECLEKISGINDTVDDINAKLEKISGIAANAEVNQNAFSNITVGTTTIEADKKTDTLTIAAGSNIILTPDATNDKITIATTDTATFSNLTTTNLTTRGDFRVTGTTTLDGNLTGKYLTGTLLQTTAATDLNNTPPKVAVLDNSGWIYSRTPNELKSDMGLSKIFIKQTISPKDWDIPANSSRGGEIKGTIKGYEGYTPIFTKCYCINSLYVAIINAWLSGSYSSSSNGYTWHIDARNFASSNITADFSIIILWIKTNLFE